MSNIYPMIGVTIEVRPTGREPYKVETQWVINRFQVPQFQPGAVIPVRIDPKDPTNVAFGGPGPSDAEPQKDGIGWGATPGATSPTETGTPEQQAEKMLRESQSRLAPVAASGTPAEAVIKTATPLNIFVNGNNPAMKFLLEVHPEAGPKFQAETLGILTEASNQSTRWGPRST